MKKILFQAFNLLFLLLISSYSVKTDNNIVWYGAIKCGSEKISGVSIKVYENGKLVESAVTGRNIGYGFLLNFNTNYDIVISKDGYLKETLQIDTHVPEEVINLGDEISWEPDIFIYKKAPGLDIEEFEIPLARFVFNLEFWRFIENTEYAKQVKPALNKVLNEIEDLKRVAYNAEIVKGDSLLISKNYEEAIIAYQHAGNYSNEDTYSKTQIKTSKKLLKKQLTEEEGYKRALSKADDYYNDGKLESAIAYYQKALIYKPKELYPLDKLYLIDSIQSYRWIKLNNKYDRYVALGDSMYYVNDYLSSKANYSDALSLFPKKIYPEIMLNKIDSIESIEQVEEKKVELAVSEANIPDSAASSTENADLVYNEMIKEADKAFKAGNYELAANYYQKALDEKPNDRFAGKQLKETEKILSQAEKPETVNLASSIKVPTAEETYSSKSIIITNESKDESLKRLREALTEKVKEGNKNATSEILEEIAVVYQNDYNLGKALEYFNQSLEIKQDIGDKKGEVEILSNIAGVMYDSGSYDEAILNFERSLDLAEEIDDKEQSSEILKNIATVYENTYRYDEAIINLKKSLEIKVEANDKPGLSEVHKNIGNIYYEQNKFDMAIKELEKSIQIDEQLDNKEELGATFNNLGAAHYNAGQYDEAINYYEKSLDVAEETNNQRDRSIALNNIGNINFDFSKFTEAIDYYEKSLEIKTDLIFKEGMAVTLHNIGNSYFKMKEYASAIEYFTASQDIAKESNYWDVIWRNYEAFAKTFAATGNYKKAYNYYKQYANSKYEMQGESEQLVEMREKYESSKIAVKSLKRELQKQHRLARYESERNRRELQIAELEVENKREQLQKQKIAIISFIIGSLLILAFALVISKQYRLKNKAFHIVAEQKRHITDGIDYAARIQKAVLPPEKYINAILPNHFIINKPRDIVGGDFYWVARHFDKVVIVVADCTGHGVPGGFMSMLGIAMLNEILSDDSPLEPHEILTQLRERVMEALHHKSNTERTSDGMDISIVILDQAKKEIQFSAAHHTMFLINSDQLELIKGERVPIGYHFKSKKFTSKTIQLQKGDMIYLASDGYTDQLGEKTLCRFMLSQFTDTLTSINKNPLEEQKKQLEEKLIDWKGNLEQTDDILVLGVRV